MSFVAERMRIPSYSPMRSRWSPSSTSKCSRSRSTPDAPIFSATRTRFTQPLQHVVDAGRERLDVGGLDGREAADAQLVAPELAVGLDVDDAVGAQRRGQGGGVDLVGEVDRRRRRASAWPGRRRTGSRRRWRSAQSYSVPDDVAVRDDAPVQAAVARASTRPGRPAAGAWRPRACCRSGPCASCPARWPATGTRGSSGPRPCSSSMRRARRGSAGRATARRRRRSTSAARSSRRRPA